MLFILYLILFFQLYYLHFSKSTISIDSIIIILITQVIISTIFYSKKTIYTKSHKKLKRTHLITQ